MGTFSSRSTATIPSLQTGTFGGSWHTWRCSYLNMIIVAPSLRCLKKTKLVMTMLTLQVELFATISITWGSWPPLPKPTTSAWSFHHCHCVNIVSTWCFGAHSWLVSMGEHCGREETMSLTSSLLLNWRKRSSLLTSKMVTRARTAVRQTTPSRRKRHFLPK